MTVTTPEAIMAKIAEVIECLMPMAVPLNDEAFRENKDPAPRLARWSLASPEQRVFRRFEVAPAPGATREDLGLQHPGAQRCYLTFLVTVAYPSRASLLGFERLREVWNVMTADAQQIRNALRPATALVETAHLENFVVVRNPDINRDHILLQELTVRAQAFVAQ